MMDRKVKKRNGASKYLDMEVWVSSANRKEIHFYQAGTDNYVFGFNPLFMDEVKALELMEQIKLKP